MIVPEAALRGERDAEAEYGSILVPIFGTPLDDDIVQTAGRLAGDEHDDSRPRAGATIEALWVFEVPMSLPIDARLPEAQLERARAALRAGQGGGGGVRGRRGRDRDGARAARRRRRSSRRRGGAGCEAIVLAAEEPSRIRGGALLGGRGGPLDNFVGEVTKYVIGKAPCR